VNNLAVIIPGLFTANDTPLVEVKNLAADPCVGAIRTLAYVQDVRHHSSFIVG
jgi:hypothetical protein